MREYHHPERLGKVMLVGAYHYGDRAYYDEIQRTIDEREAAGAKVHYERVRPATPEELAAATEREKIAHGMHRRSIAPAQRMLQIGLLFQGEAIEYRPTWENHDIDALTAVRSFGVETVISRFIAKEDDDRQTAKSELTIPQLRSGILAELAAYRKLAQLPEEEEIARRETSFGAGTQYRTMVTLREEVAMRAADEHFAEQPDADLVMLWGAGHMPTLQRSLRGRGFALADERHIPIVSTPAFLPAEDPYAQFIVPGSLEDPQP